MARVSRPAGAEITGQATRATRTPGRAWAKLPSNIDDGALVVGPTDRAEVITLAERIAAPPAVGDGHRFRDVLHIATAQSPGTAAFRSFDSKRDGPPWPRAARQRRIDGRQRGMVNFEVHQDTKQGSVGDL